MLAIQDYYNQPDMLISENHKNSKAIVVYFCLQSFLDIVFQNIIPSWDLSD